MIKLVGGALAGNTLIKLTSGKDFFALCVAVMFIFPRNLRVGSTPRACFSRREGATANDRPSGVEEQQRARATSAFEPEPAESALTVDQPSAASTISDLITTLRLNGRIQAGELLKTLGVSRATLMRLARPRSS